MIEYLDAEYGMDYIEGHKEVNPKRNCPGKEGMETVNDLRNDMNKKSSTTTPGPIIIPAAATCNEEACID